MFYIAIDVESVDMEINKLNTASLRSNYYQLRKTENKPNKNFKSIGNAPLNFSKTYPIPFLGNIDFDLRKEALRAVENDTPLSNDGFKGIVYKINHKGKNYAVKVGRFEDSDFLKEAQVLKHVPKTITQSQHFVDYFQNEGKDVLISTLVSGEKGVLKSDADFKNYFELLFKLDKSGVFHGDLNMANCFFDNDKINLIDYGEGSLFSSGEKMGDLFPDFVLKTNGANLENNGMPDCIKNWKTNGLETKKLFETYLENKAHFYSKHHKLIKKNYGSAPRYEKAIDYEENLSKVLKNPSEEVLKNEARRIDLLYTFEYANTSTRYHKIPRDAVYNWSLTMDKAKNALKTARKILENGNLKPLERKYFEYQTQIYQKMYITLQIWRDNTLSWIEDIVSATDENLDNYEKTFYLNRNLKTDYEAPDIYSYIVD